MDVGAAVISLPAGRQTLLTRCIAVCSAACYNAVYPASSPVGHSKLGYILQLECRANGKPTPNIHWTQTPLQVRPRHSRHPRNIFRVYQEIAPWWIFSVGFFDKTQILWEFYGYGLGLGFRDGLGSILGLVLGRVRVRVSFRVCLF